MINERQLDQKLIRGLTLKALWLKDNMEYNDYNTFVKDFTLHLLTIANKAYCASLPYLRYSPKLEAKVKRAVTQAILDLDEYLD